MGDEITDQLQTISETSALAALQLLDPLLIAERSGDIHTDSHKYNLIIHSELCRFKMLGLTDANAARAIGINPQTLKGWADHFPQLRIDMEQASQLATAIVAGMLFNHMQDSGPVALNAIKFWLTSRAEEFKQKAELEVHASAGQDEIEDAIKRIYGVGHPQPVPGESANAGAIAGDNQLTELPAPGNP